MTTENLEWIKKVQEEAQQLGQVLFANFKYALELATKHCPDQLNPEQRARVFETVVQAWLGAAIIPIASYGNSTKEIEDLVVEEIRLKFDWIRRNEKDLQMARLDQMAQGNKPQLVKN